jgi:IS5 family transposase
MKQPHDTQVGWQVLVRNLDALSTFAADKGYDWENFEHGSVRKVSHR